MSRKSRRSPCAAARRSTRRCCAGRCATGGSPSRSAWSFSSVSGFIGSRLGSEFLPTLEEGNLWIRASMPPTISLEAGDADRQPDPRDSAALSGSHHRGLAAWPARRRQRCGGLLQCRVLRAAQAVRPVAAECDQGKADQGTAGRIRQGVRRHRFQFLAIHPGQCRGGTVGRQRRQLGQDHRTRSRDAGTDRQAPPCTKWRKSRALPISACSGCSASPT